MDFKLPDIGEGIHEGEIVKWLVKEGDIIKEDQPMVEVMTDKATVEIPSPSKGKIQKIYFKEGQTVQVDTVIVTIVEEGATSHSTASMTVSETSSHDSKPPGTPPSIISSSTVEVLATPAVRKLAKDLGIDLSRVKGTGHGGRVTEEDIKKTVTYSREAQAEGAREGMSSRVEATRGVGEGSHASFERFSSQPIPKLGSEERISLYGIRKSIAHHLQMAKYYAPHFTYVEEVDLTDLVHLRDQVKKDADKKGVKITYLSYFVKALPPVLKEFSYLNASLDETTHEIVLKKYFNIGIAVATSDGLIVPVIKDADKKSLYDVAKEIVHLSDLVRTHKARPQDLKGSSFSVTSIGSIGGVLATPILNYPDVAILGINQIKERPVVREGKVVIRHIMYLSLTLDHRVVDGAMAAQFMNRLVEKLQNPKEIS